MFKHEPFFIVGGGGGSLFVVLYGVYKPGGATYPSHCLRSHHFLVSEALLLLRWAPPPAMALQPATPTCAPPPKEILCCRCSLCTVYVVYVCVVY